MKLHFRTADSIPPPYANEVIVEIQSNNTEADFRVSFTQTYFDREDLDEEEILEEGFTPDDDVNWNGSLNANWQAAFATLTEKLKPFKEVRSAVHDAISVEINGEQFSPSNIDQFKRLIEQLQQAIFEIEGREKPLSIEIIEMKHSGERSTKLKASFAERKYQQIIDNQEIDQHWNQLDEHLKLLFAGDYFYEKATNKSPKRNGLFVNLGNEWWFEVGKSLLVSPDKINGFLV